MTVKSLASIDARIRELKAELEASPAYLELAVLEEMRPKLAAINGAAQPQMSGGLKRKGKQPKGERTQHEAAEKAVEAAGHPLSIEEIVAKLPNFGAVISGKNAKPNLTSVLNKRSGLKAVKWRGKSAWWFKNKQLPEVLS